ncbi:hypothetical protein B0H17DRAFT_1039950 [Mycena rosella]|uniref:Uncharacterized protein n=1 Tax=Mycena rosella TaxID=1033263 RepID=A0AAD7M7F0_MYCRO|nr:hypothetical protein B0H17DRAFT_1039950 [Mycena rosella]
MPLYVSGFVAEAHRRLLRTVRGASSSWALGLKGAGEGASVSAASLAEGEGAEKEAGAVGKDCEGAERTGRMSFSLYCFGAAAGVATDAGACLPAACVRVPILACVRVIFVVAAAAVLMLHRRAHTGFASAIGTSAFSISLSLPCTSLSVASSLSTSRSKRGTTTRWCSPSRSPSCSPRRMRRDRRWGRRYRHRRERAAGG